LLPLLTGPDDIDPSVPPSSPRWSTTAPHMSMTLTYDERLRSAARTDGDD